MFNKIKNFFAEKKTYNPFNIFGASGTEIFDGLISQEYLADLQGQNAIEVWNKMRSSDTMVQAGIQAFKLPLLSANYFIEGDNEEYNEFIEGCLFDNNNQDWNQLLNEVYNFPVFGFYYFEKIFKLREDGKIVWSEFAPRIPSAHYRWPTVDSYTVQQLLTGSEYMKDGVMVKAGNNVEIPFDKLLYFVYQKEGDNYEGRSILRPVRQAWLYKQKMLKILAVYYERFGIGTPFAKLKNANDTDIKRYENMFTNMRSNKQSYIISPNVEDEFGFFGAEQKNDLSTGMSSYIEYLDRQIAKAFLAMFLSTGDNGVGSNAKQGVDVEFFMLTIKSIATTFTDVMNNAIRELIKMNYPTAKQEDMPKLKVTELEKIDTEAFSNMIEKLTNTGYISPTNKTTQDYIRESLDLPELTDEEFEKSVEEAKQKEEAMQKQEKLLKKEDMEKETKDEEKEIVKDKKKIEEVKKKSQLSDVQLSVISEAIKKEKIYQKSIDEEEKFLQSTYNDKFLPAIETIESTIKKFLLKEYDKLDTEVVGGVKKIKRNGNQKIRTEMIQGINKIMGSFKDKIENLRFVESIHKKSMNNAISVIKEIDKKVEFMDIAVKSADLASFVAGYKSNMDGVVYNESRRVKERIHDNITQGVSLSLAKKQVEDILFNRNIYKLSAITHPRALYRKTIQAQATSEGVTNFKALAPSIAKVGALGLSALVLYQIKTQQGWDKMNGTKDNVNVVGGMGLQHNSLIYFMPIFMSEMEEQEEISRRQRAKFDEEQMEIEEELDKI